MAETGDGGESTKLQFYSYWWSSCSCRVSIALNLKGLDYEYKAVNLAKGEQFSPEFLKLNPMGYLPALVDGDIVISDSFAILMVRLRLELISSSHNGCEYCFCKHTASPKSSHSSLEKLLKSYAGKYATGDEIYLADLFLVPQIHAAIKKFNVDMNEYPLLSRIHEAYKEVPAIQNGMPEKQPDTPAEARA